MPSKSVDQISCKNPDCNNTKLSPKGWCSRQCYLQNQHLNGGNKAWFKRGYKQTKEDKRRISESNRQWHKENPQKSAEIIKKMNTKEVNVKKGHKGKEHPMWIEDRSKVKQNRCYYEEKIFMKKILKERNYTCELTGERGGQLSVHHLDSVHLFPEKKFDVENVIVIKRDIHMDFHKKYGFQWATKEKFIKYLEEGDYASSK